MKRTLHKALSMLLTAAMAYEALSDADKAAFEATEQYTKLMALRDVLYGIVHMTESTWDISKGDLTLTNACGASCTHTVTGTKYNACAFEITNAAATMAMAAQSTSVIMLWCLQPRALIRPTILAG